ncbi:MAG: hypothetical protein A2W22_03130 [Candidatus Levybacteria bacterium RBG_16_35_11]|nr:MAG: hypothetical protein A2W22_03130 [Candidatus Levybacteria bacterium RBG_16_35_11]
MSKTTVICQICYKSETFQDKVDYDNKDHQKSYFTCKECLFKPTYISGTYTLDFIEYSYPYPFEDALEWWEYPGFYLNNRIIKIHKKDCLHSGIWFNPLCDCNKIFEKLLEFRWNIRKEVKLIEDQVERELRILKSNGHKINPEEFQYCDLAKTYRKLLKENWEVSVPVKIS